MYIDEFYNYAESKFPGKGFLNGPIMWF